MSQEKAAVSGRSRWLLHQIASTSGAICVELKQFTTLAKADVTLRVTQGNPLLECSITRKVMSTYYIEFPRVSPQQPV